MGLVVLSFILATYFVLSLRPCRDNEVGLIDLLVIIIVAYFILSGILSAILLCLL